VSLSDAAARAADEAARLARADGAVLAAAAVDTSRWEVVHFSLWDSPLWEHDVPGADGDVFQVLHLSAPGVRRLPRGRQW
jgi:hypothetical protein